MYNVGRDADRRGRRGRAVAAVADRPADAEAARRRPARPRARPPRAARRRRGLPRDRHRPRSRPARSRRTRSRRSATWLLERGRRSRSARRPPRSPGSRPGAPASATRSAPQTMPAEAGINDRAVSFTKGCYIGQETVARLHYKGKPNRHLRRLGSERAARRRGPGRRRRTRGRDRRDRRDLARRGPLALAILRREAGPGDEVDRRRRESRPPSRPSATEAVRRRSPALRVDSMRG